MGVNIGDGSSGDIFTLGPLHCEGVPQTGNLKLLTVILDIAIRTRLVIRIGITTVVRILHTRIWKVRCCMNGPQSICPRYTSDGLQIDVY